MNKKVLLWSVATVVGVGLLVGAVFLLQNSPNDSDQTPSTTTAPSEVEQEVTENLEPGRYEAYDASLVATEGYSETILFFHAPWCPECRAFETAIEASTIPTGIQILKVDYDSATELRQEYGVTLQSTFVSLDDDGKEVTKWVGYGKDKSVDTILRNT